MDEGGERPEGAERAKNNLLATYEFYYFIIDVEIKIRVVTSDRRPPHRPFDIKCHYHRISRNRGRSGAAISLPEGCKWPHWCLLVLPYPLWNPVNLEPPFSLRT